MTQSLVDTDILSMFFRDQATVTEKFFSYLSIFKKINISIITYYEVMSGLKHRDAKKQMASFLDFVSLNTVLPVTENSATISSEIYAGLRLNGKPLDDIDVLIAGIAIENNLTLITHNIKHFKRIKQLKIEDWSE